MSNSQTPSQKNILFKKNPDFWGNISSLSLNILNLLKNTTQSPGKFTINNPSKINPDESVCVSLYLYNITENHSIKNHKMEEISKTDHYSLSEQTLHYIITIHSENHMLEIGGLEKILGVIYSNSEIPISKFIKKAHLEIDFSENPIDVWNRIFPSIPYRPSVLLTVHGSGVVYLDAEIKSGFSSIFND